MNWVGAGTRGGFFHPTGLRPAEHDRGMAFADSRVCFFHFNPHAGAAAGTNSDENGAARFPFSDTMGLREAHYKAR